MWRNNLFSKTMKVLLRRFIKNKTPQIKSIVSKTNVSANIFWSGVLGCVWYPEFSITYTKTICEHIPFGAAVSTLLRRYVHNVSSVLNALAETDCQGDAVATWNINSPKQYTIAKSRTCRFDNAFCIIPIAVSNSMLVKICREEIRVHFVTLQNHIRKPTVQNASACLKIKNKGEERRYKYVFQFSFA